MGYCCLLLCLCFDLVDCVSCCSCKYGCFCGGSCGRGLKSGFVSQCCFGKIWENLERQLFIFGVFKKHYKNRVSAIF